LDQIVNFLIWKIGVQPQGYVFLSMVSSFSLVFLHEHAGDLQVIVLAIYLFFYLHFSVIGSSSSVFPFIW
jgi:hypothetical protein